jgi:predicted metal-dependent HD superfamily phosphohydrolase
MDDLREHFVRLAHKVQVPNDAVEQWWKKISMYCQEKQRHYHTLNHLRNLFKVYNEREQELKVDPAQKHIIDLCTFFHE